MRKFGRKNCCNCNTKLQYNGYILKGGSKGMKYYCVSCGDRK